MPAPSDAPRPTLGAKAEACAVTRSVTGCVPTQSVGTIIASNADVNGRAQNRRVEVNLGPIPGQQYGQPGQQQAPQQNNQFQGNPYQQYQ